MGSPKTLVDLPFDIVHLIARRLDVRSYHHLEKTCRGLRQFLWEQDTGGDPTARLCLETSMPHSTWVRLARSGSGQGRFKRLPGRISRREHSLQSASPYSVSILGRGTSFVYDDGVLCYSTTAGIRILDFNHGNTTEKVLSGRFFSSHSSFEDPDGKTLDPEVLQSTRVCSYSEKIVVCLCDFGPHGHFLFAVNVDEGFEPPVRSLTSCTHDRVLLCVRVRSVHKLFVRHDSLHLVYGTHSARGMRGHHEWLLEVYSLDTGKVVSKEPLQLENFYGSEIGSSACFTISDGHFYAVSSQTSLEREEAAGGWTSHYHFISFRLHEPCPDLRIRAMWRRDHMEGPINDAWTILEFQQDYRTGESLLIECRKEWKNGGSRSFRTAYSQPFHRAEHWELTDDRRQPSDDPPSGTVDEENSRRYEAARPRVPKYTHSEEGATGCVKEYIRAKTKWNGYCFNSQSFVDMVTEEYTPDGEWRPRERVKLRAVTREHISPLVVDTVKPKRAGGMIVRPCRQDREGEDMLDGEEEFSASHISLWPEDDAPPSLQEILCPGGRVSEVRAMLGDEGLIYMAGPLGDRGERALVFVSFDPTFGFEGMTRPDGSPVRQRREDGKLGASSGRAVKRASSCVSDAEEGGATLACARGRDRVPSQDGEVRDLPDRTKRVKTQDGRASREGPSVPREMNPISSAMPIRTLSAGTPLLPPPPPVERLAPSCGHGEASTGPTSCSSSSATVSRLRAASITTSHASSSPHVGTNLTSTEGLLTWREKAGYLVIAKGLWTR